MSDSSQITTVLAPISTRLSRPNPESATDRARAAAIRKHDDPDDVPPQGDPFEDEATPEQTLGIGAFHASRPVYAYDLVWYGRRSHHVLGHVGRVGVSR